jgi:hypothetical protein
MRITYNEGKWRLNIMLHPETAEEMAELCRVALNAKAVKPHVWLTFRDEKPYLNIDIEKIKDSVQVNSIHPPHQ